MLTRLKNGSWIKLADVRRLKPDEHWVRVNLGASETPEVIYCDTHEAALAYCDELGAMVNAAKAVDLIRGADIPDENYSSANRTIDPPPCTLGTDFSYKETPKYIRDVFGSTPTRVDPAEAVPDPDSEPPKTSWRDNPQL